MSLVKTILDQNLTWMEELIKSIQTDGYSFLGISKGTRFSSSRNS